MNDETSERELLRRIRERAADPRTRTDERPSSFVATAGSASLGDLLSMGREAAGALRSLLDGGVTDDLLARAEGYRAAMETPAEQPLPAPATPGQLDAAERRLGRPLPRLLRRLYAEVANGGFGPGPGLVGVAGGATTDRGRTLEDLYDEMRDAVTEDPRWVWPPALLPVADLGGVFACVDADSDAQRVVEFDFEELDEPGGERGWTRAFSDRAPSLAAWLEAWLAAPSTEEREAARRAEIAAAMSTLPEATKQYWLAMTPEERAAYGLPEKGWGRVMFGDYWGDDPRDGSGEG